MSRRRRGKTAVQELDDWLTVSTANHPAVVPGKPLIRVYAGRDGASVSYFRAGFPRLWRVSWLWSGKPGGSALTVRILLPLSAQRQTLIYVPNYVWRSGPKSLEAFLRDNVPANYRHRELVIADLTRLLLHFYQYIADHKYL